MVAALRLVWDCSRGWSLLNAALLVVQGILPLGMLYLFKLLVDAVVAAMAAPATPGIWPRIGLYIGVAFVLGLAGAVARALSNLATEAQGQLVADHVQNAIHAKSVALDQAYYEDPAFHDLLHRAQHEAPFRPQRIMNGLQQAGRSLISLAGVAALLAAFAWFVLPLFVLAALPGVAVKTRWAHRSYDWQRRRVERERRAWYLHRLLTEPGFAKETRLFRLGPRLMEKYRAIRRQIHDEKTRMLKAGSLGEVLAQGGTLVVTYGVLAWMAWRTVQGGITIGDLVMYAQAFQRAQGFFQEVVTALAKLYEDNLFLAGLHDFLALPQRMPTPPAPRPLPRPPVQGIVLEHVSFRYPHGNHWALRDVNLVLPPRALVGLIGRNGAGKSTLMKLLCRLYDPDEGRILFDGVDLREADPAELRRRIGVLFQDFIRYYMSARENIHVGCVELPESAPAIPDAARQSGADAVISRLPAGYDTLLGELFGRGDDLSLGEWQKIALARAFVADADWLVLDEPSSALDVETEQRLAATFAELARTRGLLLISHRLAAVRQAAVIYVMDQGRIVEQGLHAELIRQPGIYRELFELQAAGYQ